MSADTEPPFDPRRFDPRSPDAMFATILAKLEEHGAKADCILEQVQKTNGRVTTLERWRDIITAKTAVISAALSVAIGIALKYFLG